VRTVSNYCSCTECRIERGEIYDWRDDRSYDSARRGGREFLWDGIEHFNVPLEKYGADAIHSTIRKLKFKRLGSGVFGTAYLNKSNNLVYKVGGADENDGYLNWVYAVFSDPKSKSNPFLPIIHSISIVHGQRESGYVVVMERLAEFPDYDPMDVIGHIDSEVDRVRRNRKPRKPKVRAVAPMKLGFMGVQDVVAPQNKKIKAVIEKSMQQHKKAFDAAVQLIVSVIKRTRRGNDIHGGNVMMRADGQLVITDPVA
jgi:hypothetical protein